jgi:hypothetical protein
LAKVRRRVAALRESGTGRAGGREPRAERASARRNLGLSLQGEAKSAAVHIAHLDMQLIEDGTYFVHEVDAEIVACGGWSRRNKLYTVWY